MSTIQISTVVKISSYAYLAGTNKDGVCSGTEHNNIQELSIHVDVQFILLPIAAVAT